MLSFYWLIFGFWDTEMHFEALLLALYAQINLGRAQETIMRFQGVSLVKMCARQAPMHYTISLTSAVLNKNRDVRLFFLEIITHFIPQHWDLQAVSDLDLQFMFCFYLCLHQTFIKNCLKDYSHTVCYKYLQILW